MYDERPKKKEKKRRRSWVLNVETKRRRRCENITKFHEWFI